MAWNRSGLPTPAAPGEDHRKCPVCGWSPCLPNCRLALNYWDVDMGLGLLQEMDPCDHGILQGLGEFKVGDEPFLPPQEYVDEGDFE